MSIHDDTGAQVWLDELALLWRKERQAHEARFAADRGERSLHERVVAGTALRRLVIDELDTTAGGRLLVRLSSHKPNDLRSFRLQPGEPVRLWHQDMGQGLRATLARKDGMGVAVIVDEPGMDEIPEELADAELTLDRDMPQATFDRGDAAIRRMREMSTSDERRALRDALLGLRAPVVEVGATLGGLAWHDAHLERAQAQAVAMALASDTIALIHGPPGTGKTRTLIEVVRQCISRGERILATAASNTAVDNLAERLVAVGVGVVRLGHPARVAPAVEERTLDVLLRRHPDMALARRWLDEAAQLRRTARARRSRHRHELRAVQAQARQLVREARQHMRQVQAGILRRAQVICATVAGADAQVLGPAPGSLRGHHEREPPDHRVHPGFDRVILDEATQAPDPLALVALLRAPRAVLAGDHRQLPPTVIDGSAARAGLGTTFFERLIERVPEAGCMLQVQHRMHAAIMAFPSQSMYSGRLYAAPAVAGHSLEGLGVEADELRCSPFSLIDTAGKGFTESTSEDDPSIANYGQAVRVAAEARRLIGRGLRPGHIAVIAAYRAQVRLLRELLAPHIEAGLEVSTVDGFQGREKEAVIVDLVRSNERGEVGFLADTRRTNVALTRARRFLLVVGDSATLGEHGYYSALFAHAEAQGAWISAWADDAPPFGP